jgi:threonine synthase
MLSQGRYALGNVMATISPAMDIQIASNFERLYFECTGRDGAATLQAFKGFAETGGFDIPAEALATMRQTFAGLGVSEADTAATIASTHADTGQLIDPHTAVGVYAARKLGTRGATTPIVVLATAHAAKFPEAVKEASGQAPALPLQAADLAARPERFERLPADPVVLKAFIRDFAGSAA